jgi:hypothetical protein
MQSLAVFIWERSTDRVAFLQHMKRTFTDINAYAKWLMEGEGSWINLVHLVIWVWNRCMAVAGVPTEKPPQLSFGVSPTVHQWCIKWGLNELDEAVLIKLGFVVGDNLNSLSETDWLGGGALTLQRRRILQAFRKDSATDSL